MLSVYIPWINWKSYAFFKTDLNWFDCFCSYFSLFPIKWRFNYFVPCFYFRSNRLQISKNGHSWEFRKIHRKTPVMDSLNKVAGLSVSNFIKKRLQHRCFLVNFAKYLDALFMQDTYGYRIPENRKINRSTGTS